MTPPASLQERLAALRERLAEYRRRISQSVSGMWSPRAIHELYDYGAESLTLLSDYAAALERAEAGSWCPCCIGKPISGKLCICDGSNSAQVAYSNLRGELHTAQVALERAERDAKSGNEALLRVMYENLQRSYAILAGKYETLLDQVGATDG